MIASAPPAAEALQTMLAPFNPQPILLDPVLGEVPKLARGIGPETKIALGVGQDVNGRPLAESAGAVFSQDEAFRYLLWRMWNPDRPFWSFGMLNPSTADHLKLDPTVKRCCSRAMAGGAGGLIVWNLFAFRATDPAVMKRAADPVGPANDLAILEAVNVSALNVAGWGAHGVHREREHSVRAMLGAGNVPLHALAFTATGLPRHPLYLSLELKPQPWRFWK